MKDLGVTAQTALFCVLGDPVAHSLSPVMHNAAFAYSGFDGVYVAFRVAEIGAAIQAIRALGIRGASVTIPHKVSAMTHIDAPDEQVKQIGAVNTLLNRGGVLEGRNSDSLGAVKALSATISPAGRHAAVIGAGGAARAVAFGLTRRGARITIVNRGRQRGESLARDIDGDYAPLAEAGRLQADILVNTTPVGMSPDTGLTPVPEACLQSGMVVMDAIYNPAETRLLREARKRGCRVVDGVEMFVCQGALQFEWWTGLSAPIEVMRRAVSDALKIGAQE